MFPVFSVVSLWCFRFLASFSQLASVRLCLLLRDRSSSTKWKINTLFLLERVVAENVRLREELEARDNEQKRILAELGAKIESSANSGKERASGKRKRKIFVPQQCRVSIFLSCFQANHGFLVTLLPCARVQTQNTNYFYVLLRRSPSNWSCFLCRFGYMYI